MISSKKLGWKVFTQHDVYQLKVVYTYICRTWRRIVKPVASNNSFGGGFRLSVASKHITWAVRENKPNETMPQLFVQKIFILRFWRKKIRLFLIGAVSWVHLVLFPPWIWNKEVYLNQNVLSTSKTLKTKRYVDPPCWDGWLIFKTWGSLGLKKI